MMKLSQMMTSWTSQMIEGSSSKSSVQFQFKNTSLHMHQSISLGKQAGRRSKNSSKSSWPGQLFSTKTTTRNSSRCPSRTSSSSSSTVGSSGSSNRRRSKQKNQLKNRVPSMMASRPGCKLTKALSCKCICWFTNKWTPLLCLEIK